MNQNCNYPIQGVPDNIPGVSYRTGKRGWMDKNVFNQWLNEPRAIDKDPAGRTRVIFMDNASGHNETPQQLESLSNINTKIRKLPANSPLLSQLLDSFVNKRIKDVWRTEWEEEKMHRMEANDWSNGPNGSGKLNNPGKPFY